MDSLSSDNYFHATNTTKNNVVSELLKGRQFTIQLQTLLHNPHPDSTDSALRLALQIFRSLTHSLSLLSSSAESADSASQIDAAAVDCDVSACSADTKNKNKKGGKDRRGHYKRRRSSDSWVTVTSTVNDGSAWRKYGQKDIMNSVYPRCYYRCTHKFEGCKATKQVQKVQGNPILYQTTYFNHHTCLSSETNTPNPMILVSDPVESNLISFQTNNIPSKQDRQYPQEPMINIVPSVKQEIKQDSTPQSAVDHQLKETVGLEPSEYKPVSGPILSSCKGDAVVPGLHSSCESIPSLHEFDMEVNQFGDIDHFQNYFD